MLVDLYGRPFALPDLRDDRWENALTGIGTFADKTTHGRFFPNFRIPDQELVEMFNGSDLAAKAVQKRPEEMFRRGYDVEASAGEGSAPKVKDSEIEKMREYGREQLDIDGNLLEADIFGREFGGYLLILGADDGGMPWEPLDESRIRTFNYLNGVDRRFAFVQSTYSRRGHPKYGKPEIYLLSNAVAYSGWDDGFERVKKKSPAELRGIGANVTLIHESRVLRFEGAPTDILTRQTLAGWTYSVLQRVYNAMRSFEHADDSVGYLLSDASQGVLKLQDLVKKIASGGLAALQARMMAMDMTRSVMRTIAIDAGSGPDGKNAENFERVQTTFSGIPETMDRKMLRLCAAMDMPANELFGQGGGGLNAAGEAEAATRKWYDGIATDQTTKLSPRLQRIYRLLALAKRGPLGGRDLRWKITHHPLWSQTDKDLAATRLSDAQRRSADITSGVVTAEEAALTVGDVYPEIDLDARREAMKGAQSFDPYENDPEDTPPSPEGGEPSSPAAPNTSIQSPPAGAPGEKLSGPDKAAAKARGDGQRVDFDGDQPRDETGKWSAGGGGASGGAGKGLGARIHGALAGAAKALRAAPGAIGRKAIEGVKKQVAEAGHAFHGIANAARGHEVTGEQKTAIRNVALKVGVAIASHGLSAALPLGAVHAELARKAIEKIAHHVAHHGLTHAVHKSFGIKLDAAMENFDPEAWLAQALERGVAEGLEKLSPDEVRAVLGELADQDDPPADPANEDTAWSALVWREDFDPDQPRETGQWHDLGSKAAEEKSAAAKESGTTAAHEAAADAHRSALEHHTQEAFRRRGLANSATTDDDRARHRAAAKRHNDQAAHHLAKMAEHSQFEVAS